MGVDVRVVAEEPVRYAAGFDFAGGLGDAFGDIGAYVGPEGVRVADESRFWICFYDGREALDSGRGRDLAFADLETG